MLMHGCLFSFKFQLHFESQKSIEFRGAGIVPHRTKIHITNNDENSSPYIDVGAGGSNSKNFQNCYSSRISA